MSSQPSPDHAWLPRASCDAQCLRAGASATSHRVIVGLRVARRLSLALLLAPVLPVLHDASVFLVITRTLNVSLASILSSSWVLGCLIAGAALYAALFGLAIAGYRTLYLNADPEVRS